MTVRAYIGRRWEVHTFKNEAAGWSFIRTCMTRGIPAAWVK